MVDSNMATDSSIDDDDDDDDDDESDDDVGKGRGKSPDGKRKKKKKKKKKKKAVKDVIDSNAVNTNELSPQRQGPSPLFPQLRGLSLSPPPCSSPAAKREKRESLLPTIQQQQPTGPILSA